MQVGIGIVIVIAIVIAIGCNPLRNMPHRTTNRIIRTTMDFPRFA
jgi:hypothetical protein